MSQYVRSVGQDVVSEKTGQPHLVNAEFRKAWMPFFCRSGHPVVTVDQFLSFVDPFLHQEAELDLPALRAKIFWTLRGQRSLQLVGWMVGPGTREWFSLSLGSLGWLSFEIWLSSQGCGLRVCLMPILL